MSMWPNICPLLMFDELTEEERSEIVLKILSKFAEQEYAAKNKESDGYMPWERNRKYLMIRAFTITDIDDLLRITCHPEVTRHTPNLIRDRENMIAWAKAMPATDHEFMILLDKKVIGECSLDEKDGDIGIMLFPEYWRQGYGTETVKWLIKFAADLGLKTVQAKADQKNTACIGLLQSLGFSRVGIGCYTPEDELERPLSELQTLLIFQKDLTQKTGEGE